LFLDLGVLHRKAAEPSLKSAAWWTVAWVCLGLSFAGVVYLIAVRLTGDREQLPADEAQGVTAS